MKNWILKQEDFLDKLSVYFHWNINLTGVDLPCLLGMFVRDYLD